MEIFGVQDVEGADQPTIDVYYAAHGSPYYRSARLNGLAWANKNNVGFSVMSRAACLVVGFTSLQGSLGQFN